jgi:sec-independent protein translocase protein TatB
MFDIGFSELMVIGIVALLVLGPERLPKAAQFVGLWVRRARAQWNSVKSEFERDMASEELKRSLQETRESLRQAEEQLRGGAAAFKTQIESGFDDAAAAIPPAPAPDHAHAVAEAAESEKSDGQPANGAHVFPDEHGEAPLESSREPLYEPPPPDDLDDDDAPPPQHADDAHAGR